MGREAYRKGERRNAYVSKDLKSILVPYMSAQPKDIDEFSFSIMKAWFDGWDEANVADWEFNSGILSMKPKVTNKGLVRDNTLPGGRGDMLTEGDVDPDQLEVGIRVEMEHTNDSKIAREIALDHLAEIPDYYSRLEEMEQGAGVGNSLGGRE